MVPEPEEDVLELTQMVEDDGGFEETPEPEDPWSFPSEPEVPFPEPEPAPEPRPSLNNFFDDPPPPPRPARPRRFDDEDDALLSASPAAIATAAFSQLTSKLGPDRGHYVAGSMPIHDGARTLEDVIRDMLRPLLREWLDENLPALVERLIKVEIEKLVRRARDY